jgi:hypothetical protein
MSFYYSKLDIARVDGPKKMPTEKHYAILIFKRETTWVPGDQRSREAPGHGYPEHTEVHETFEYWATASTSILRQAVEYLEKRNGEVSAHDKVVYSIIESVPLSVQTRIEIEIKGRPHA